MWAPEAVIGPGLRVGGGHAAGEAETKTVRSRTEIDERSQSQRGGHVDQGVGREAVRSRAEP